MVHDEGAIAPTDKPLIETIRSRVGTAVVLTVTGEIDMLTAASLRTVVDGALSGPPATALIIDVSRMGFFGSAGLAVLAEAGSVSPARGMVLRVVVDHHQAVTRALQVAGLDRRLVVFRSLSDALAADSDASGDVLT